jgi:hypothetical protein
MLVKNFFVSISFMMDFIVTNIFIINFSLQFDHIPRWHMSPI